MFTIFTKYDELDGVKDGFVDAKIFATIFYDDLALRSQERIDFKFLSLKYRDPYAYSYEDQQNVYYEQFYKDYDDIETNGLGSKIFGLKKDIYENSNKS
jgi:hypothetical protein